MIGGAGRPRCAGRRQGLGSAGREALRHQDASARPAAPASPRPGRRGPAAPAASSRLGDPSRPSGLGRIGSGSAQCSSLIAPRCRRGHGRSRVSRSWSPVDPGVRGHGSGAPGLEPGQHGPLGERRQPGGRVVERGQRTRQLGGCIGAALDRERALCRSRQEVVRVEQLGDVGRRVPAGAGRRRPARRRPGRHRRAAAGSRRCPGSRPPPGRAAARAAGRPAAASRCPPWRRGGEVGQATVRPGRTARRPDPRAAAPRPASRPSAGCGRQVLERVDGEVALAGEHGGAHRAHEDPGTAEAGQRGVGQVAVRGDPHQLHLMAEGAQRSGDHAPTGSRQGSEPRVASRSFTATASEPSPGARPGRRLRGLAQQSPKQRWPGPGSGEPRAQLRGDPAGQRRRRSAGWVPTVGVRTSRMPSSAAVCVASVSRSQITSMWSEMKPIGTSTTSVVPAAASSARASLTSGSSHGTDGGPLRDWKTRSHGSAIPVAGRESRRPPAPATQRCCST